MLLPYKPHSSRCYFCRTLYGTLQYWTFQAEGVWETRRRSLWPTTTTHPCAFSSKTSYKTLLCEGPSLLSEKWSTLLSEDKAIPRRIWAGCATFFLMYYTYLIPSDLSYFYTTVHSFFKKIIYLFLERGEGREKDMERNIKVRNIDWLLLIYSPPGDWTSNPGMCPDRESNQRLLGLQDDAQPSRTTPVRAQLSTLYQT